MTQVIGLNASHLFILYESYLNLSIINFLPLTYDKIQKSKFIPLIVRGDRKLKYPPLPNSVVCVS